MRARGQRRGAARVAPAPDGRAPSDRANPRGARSRPRAPQRPPVTLLVRSDGPIVDPSWSAEQVGLEDLLLAYMAPERLRRRTAASGEAAPAMAWVTWRQHRPQLLVGLATARRCSRSPRSITVLPIRAAYHRHALVACLPPSTRSGCDIIVSHFRVSSAARVDGGALADRSCPRSPGSSSAPRCWHASSSTARTASPGRRA